VEEDKSLRVVVRGLHHTSSIEEIKSEIRDHGFEVRNVVNVLHLVTKSPLPLLFVDLSPQANIKEIYKIDILYNSRVRIEESYKKNFMPQCQRLVQLCISDQVYPVPEVNLRGVILPITVQY
jgi:hypothetical protein